MTSQTEKWHPQGTSPYLERIHTAEGWRQCGITLRQYQQQLQAGCRGQGEGVYAEVIFPQAGEPETHRFVQLRHSIQPEVFQKSDIRRKLSAVGEKEQCTRPNLEPVISFSCAEQRFVIQIKSKSSIFLLWIMLLELYLRILYPILGPKDFLWFSSEGFIVLHFISKSVVYFELILYKIWGLAQSSFLLLFYFIN